MYLDDEKSLSFSLTKDFSPSIPGHAPGFPAGLSPSLEMTKSKQKIFRFRLLLNLS